MWKSALSLDKYQYVRSNPYYIRLLGFLGILTTLLMGIGLWQFLNIKWIYLLVFGPGVAIFLLNKVLRYALQTFYPKFNIKKHEAFVSQFWSTHEVPTVDVFLPWAGEDLAIHEEVVKAVSQIQYSGLHVYMLDDVGNEDHKRLAEKYGFTYLSRPNKGEYKKSGNLQYGYEHSKGEFIFILDADFIPTKESLHDLIPYIASDPEIGILQTPQYFEQTKEVHSRSKIEFGGGNIVEDFYRIIQPCRDEFKAGMCVGTSAVYRRTAILKLNGTPKVHASEDLATGLLITRFGYYVKYLPLITSMGKSPETYQGYFKQHMRWCSGNLVFAKYWPGAHMNLVARIIYITNPLYYLSEALTVVFAFQFLVLLYFHADTLSIYNTIYFIPYIILSRLIIPTTKTKKNKVGTKLAALNNAYTYFYTYIHMLTKGVPNWHPTGVKIRNLHGDFVQAMNIGAAISTTFVLCFIFVIISRPTLLGNYNTYIVLGWAFYSVFWHVLFLHSVHTYIHPLKSEHLSSRVDKAFLYAKTHSVMFLFFMLIGSTLFEVIINLINPATPTRAVYQNILTTSSSVFTPQVTAIPIPETSYVMKNIAHDPKEARPQVYAYTVERGDSLSKLAKEAVRSHASDKKYSLNEKQIDYSSNYLAMNSQQKTTVEVGDQVAFAKKLVDDSVKKALEKKILVTD